MAAPSESKPLTLTVSNFGPIAEANVELRPLTVFVGPSNTGKSYLATLIYALHRFFGDYGGNVGVGAGWSVSAMRAGSLALSENDVTTIFDWVNETLSDLEAYSGRSRRFPDKLTEPVELPEPIAGLTRSVIGNVSHLAETLATEIGRCFGIEGVENLSRYSAEEEAKCSLSGCPSELDLGLESWAYTFAVAAQQHELSVSIPGELPLRIAQTLPFVNYSRYLRPDQPDRRLRVATHGIIRQLANVVVSDMVGPLSRPAYYLPADRAGVMHAHRVVVRALIANASRAGLRHDTPLPVLSGVLGDFLEQLLDLADVPGWSNGHGNDLARRLERSLMKGDVHIEQEQIGYPSFVFTPDGWRRDLPLMNASSMVSELTPVVLYLRELVEPGETLIIEEPESHLHPQAQVDFTRVLAAAVKAGIRIVITTHSEWVLEELANLVRMSELPDERRNGLDAADFALTPDEVGAWFFDPNGENGGSVVREIPLDVDSGTFPSGFGLVTADLYNRWVEITSRVENG